MLFSRIKQHPEIIFIIFALCFGVIFAIKVIPFSILDGGEHYWRSLEVSKGILFNGNKNTWVGGYSPVMYFASALGLKLCNYYFLAGRIFNLLAWIILIASAIRITPVFKWLFLIAALYPNSLYQGMSYSADSFSNAFSFLFFAYLFKLIFNNKDFSYKKDIPLLSLCSVIGALCKGAIFPIFLFPLVEMKNKKHKYFIFCFLLFLSVGTFLLWKITGTGSIAKEVNSEYNLHYIYAFPLQFLFMIFKTIIISIKDWIYGCIGYMGWIILNPGLVWTTFVVSLSVMFFVSEKYQVKCRQRVVSFVALFLYTIFTCLLLYFIYTPAWSATILGVQPRYFVQVLPLIFLCLGGVKNKYNQNSKSQYIENIVINSALFYTFLILIYCSYIVT